MKYNRALDYVAAALECARTGKTEQAAKLFLKAAKDPQAEMAVSIINVSNQKAFDAIKAQAKKEAAAAARKKVATKSAAQRRLEATDLDPDLDQDIAGDELKIDIDSQETMPEVQEGAAEDEDDSDDEDTVEESRFRRILANLTR